MSKPNHNKLFLLLNDRLKKKKKVSETKQTKMRKTHLIDCPSTPEMREKVTHTPFNKKNPLF